MGIVGVCCFSMSVALLWVVSPNSEVSYGTGFLDSVREGNRGLESSRFPSRDRNSMWKGGFKKGGRQGWNFGFLNADLRYSCLGRSRTENGRSFSVQSSLVASPAGEMAVSSEKKVYEVVLKQAALVKRHLISTDDIQVKPDIVLPGNLGLLSEAYDRCGEVCAEYAKTFYLGQSQPLFLSVL